MQPQLDGQENRQTETLLKSVLKGKIVIVGVGNTLRGDDGFGPALAERLRGEVNALCIDAGTTPENYLGKIAAEKPDTVLIVDAVHLGLPPGRYEILRKHDILSAGFTTHDISPRLFVEYLERKTEAQIYMLAVQPARLDFGAEISPNVKTTLDSLSAFLIAETPK